MVLFFAVNFHLLKTRGQTVGKALLRIRIVDASGSVPPIGVLLLRRYAPFWAVSYVPVVGSIAVFVDPLFIFRRDRRCLHDLLAETQVVWVAT